jgi:hypothetical protein
LDISCKNGTASYIKTSIPQHEQTLILSYAQQTPQRHGDIRYTSDRRIAGFIAIVSTINAAALLIGAIVSLYTVASPRKKLGIIAGFTSLFAINVGVLTNARRAELFAATAG